MKSRLKVVEENKALFKGTIIGVILTIVVDQILHLAKIQN
jgi:hypothetical protein